MKEKPIKTPLSKPQKNYREGHCARLRDRFREGGPSAVQEHELLKLVLFRDIPRRDVKELAHELLDKFGDLSGVLGAPRQELEKIKGVSERVVDEFHIIRAAALTFGKATINHKKALANLDALVAYARTKMAENKSKNFMCCFSTSKTASLPMSIWAAARLTIRRSIRAK